jgi:ADP-heptose:LPS heptosyltransferase
LPRPKPALLALRALWLGDLLTAVPSLRALADTFPRHRRVLAAPAVLAPLVELSGVGFELVGAAPLAPLPDACARPQVAVNLHGRGPESHRTLLATEPARLVAFRHPDVAATEDAPTWRPDEHEAVRWCRLLAESGIPADPAALRLRRPPMRFADLRGATILHAGAKAAERRWPAARWARVARAEIAAHRKVVLTGSAAERPLALEIASLAGADPRAVLAGRTGLGALAALVAHAGRVISADTGVAHLATALGTPSVTLFGPAPPCEWGPLIDPEIHRVIFKRSDARPAAGQTHPALLEVTPEEVVEAAGALPTAVRSARRPATGAGGGGG